MAKQIQNFTDVFGGKFYPDMPTRDLSECLDTPYEITDATVIPDFETKFGTHDLALLLLTDLKTGDKFTTASSGIVIVKKIGQILSGKVKATFPLIGTITRRENYYDIV